MIEHNVAQGSAPWFKLRIGRPTASDMHLIITPAKGDLSESWKPYMARLIWERLTNSSTESLEGIRHMEEGKRLEPQAIRQLEFVTGLETRKCGFFTTDDGLIGASPDRMVVGRNVCVETKSPTGPVHMGYLLFGTGPKYRPQVQSQLLVCEADEGVFYSYVERAPAYQITTNRDEPYIVKMQAALRQFTDNLQLYTERALAMGVFQAFEDIVLPLEAEHGPAMRRGMPQPDGLDRAARDDPRAKYGIYPKGDPRWMYSGG